MSIFGNASEKVCDGKRDEMRAQYRNIGGQYSLILTANDREYRKLTANIVF
jgi:hypothetical protein